MASETRKRSNTVKDGTEDASGAVNTSFGPKFSGVKVADLSAAAAAAASSRVLSRLLTLEDVLGAVEEASEIVSVIKRGRLPGIDALRPVLVKLAQMSTVGNFADTIAMEGGSAAIVAIVRAALAKVRAKSSKDSIFFFCLHPVSMSHPVSWHALSFAGRCCIEGRNSASRAPGVGKCRQRRQT